jgi:hypothetical protein
MPAADYAAALPADTLGYAYNGGGLNNQKLALLGLCLKAWRDGPRRLILPDLLQFDIVTFKHRPVPMAGALEVEALREFLAQEGIEVLAEPPRGDQGAWWYFHHGNNHLAAAMLAGELDADSFPCRFFRALKSVIGASDLFRRLADAVFGARGIGLVAQLRIEEDWGRHSRHFLSGVLGDAEDYAPSFRDIMAKLVRTLPETRAIYVVSDEAALPVPKDEIRAAVRDDFGIELCWKSDILPAEALGALSLLELSMLDFEMALAAQSFVGMSRSTFSNMAAFERFARTRAPVRDHYIYNLPGPALARRHDNGAFSAPEMAAAADPRAPHLSFAQAQIHLDVDDKVQALERYALRAEQGGSAEETYVSLYRAAQLKAELGADPDDVVATYLRAADVLPSRAEALHGASYFCRGRNRFAEGYAIAKRGVDLAVPERGLFIERWVYDYALLDELAVNAYWSGHPWECAKACVRILGRGTAPPDAVRRVTANAHAALDRIKPSSRPP